ncbi:hypothetical protein QPK32_18395 [Massilia sp. YIM B02763]|uniref:hypothetical protein n=1 Tax=Massilia sp. YIM B02763 TaxID=3050130 RepID=UPI0025B703D8|nr:hypothetical protein [Massilia sp. YIM B02763]MDN4055045.1 hypothetical protein [Massilia sp. YIM B02763]
MNPLVHSLCQNSFIGPILFIGTACAFPPLFSDAPLALDRKDARVIRAFVAPVDTAYTFYFAFKFPSQAAYRQDAFAGTFDGRYCGRDAAIVRDEAKPSLGRPVSVQVTIREQANGRIVADRRFETLCTTSHDPSTLVHYRDIGTVRLDAGHYVAEIRNVDAHAGLDANVTVGLGPAAGK